MGSFGRFGSAFGRVVKLNQTDAFQYCCRRDRVNCVRYHDCIFFFFVLLFVFSTFSPCITSDAWLLLIRSLCSCFLKCIRVTTYPKHRHKTHNEMPTFSLQLSTFNFQSNLLEQCCNLSSSKVSLVTIKSSQHRGTANIESH